MSSYLTFYGIPKAKVERKEGETLKKTEDVNAQPIEIVSFSRSHDVYQYFNENCQIAFSYDERKYSDITESDVDKVESDIMETIRSSEKRLNEYEKYAASNPDYVSEILSIKEFLEDLYRVLHYTEFIGYIVRDAASDYCGGFTRIVASIA